MPKAYYIGSFVYDIRIQRAYFMKESSITQRTWDDSDVAPWIYEQHRFELCVKDGKNNDKEIDIHFIYQVYDSKHQELPIPLFDNWGAILDNLRDNLFIQRKYTPCQNRLSSAQTTQPTLF